MIKRCFYNPYLTGLISVLPSILVFYYAIGFDHLDIYNVNWITGDMAQVYMAWKQYIIDDHSFFDLHTNRLSYPLDISIALFDVMPILVILTKPFHGILPSNTQYIGLYYLLCIILQGYFGYLSFWYSASKINVKIKIVFCFIVSCFFVMSPATLARMQGHIALSSHWVILFGVFLNIRFPLSKSYENVFINALLLFFAAGINPYIAMMSLFTPIFFLIGGLYDKKVYLKDFLIKTSIVIFSVLLGFYLFGFFDASGGGIHGGYGIYSMNMLAPIDPNHFGSILLFDIPTSVNEQTFEGFQYQGLGLILMVLVSIFIFNKEYICHSNLRHNIVFLIVFSSYVISLSNIVTFGDVFNVKIAIPNFIESILEKFRASGRFFWIGGFWIIIISSIVITHKYKYKFSIFILSFFLFIQVIDLVGVVKGVRNHLEHTQTKLLPSSVVQFLDEADFNQIVVLPPWQCDPRHTPGGVDNYETLGFLAINYNVPINNFYAARTPGYQRDFHCNNKKNEFKKDILYVLSIKEFLLNRSNLVDSNFSCKKIGDQNAYIFCLYKKIVDFDVEIKNHKWNPNSYGNDGLILGDGWSNIENWGVWSLGEESNIKIYVDSLPKKMFLTFEINVFNSNVKQSLEIYNNLNLVYSDVFIAGGDSSLKIKIDTDDLSITNQAYVALRFVHLDAISPLDVGLSNDDRALAIGIKNIYLEDK